ncbi:MAG: FtsQ-type POTRA domain-containing protein, partial [Acidimicrobiia bacterium]|nr:FtsQ-type POTRA domain-containing protein [Acidimicrobiia bacterium]
MSTAIDPRIADRRKAVAEHGARKGLRKMLGLLALCGLVGSAVWFVQSSALDLDIVAVHGAVRSDPGAVLAQHGVGEDTPVWLAQWRASDIEESLKAHPWVKDAVVKVAIPDTIEIEVLEYEGAAWVQGATAWSLVASDGAVLSIDSSPDSVLPRFDLVVDAVV